MVDDLSLPLQRGMPGYPGYPGYDTEQLQEHGTDGKVSHRIEMNTHQGTHIDAPAHFIEGGQTVGELSLETLQGPARVVDLRAYRGEAITAEILSAEAPDLTADRVLLLTGDVDARFDDQQFYDAAAVLTADAAGWLIDCGVSLVGNDFLTEGIETDDRPVHHALLGDEIPIVEYLCNSGAIIDQTTVEFRCLPLQTPGLESSPVLAVAL